MSKFLACLFVALASLASVPLVAAADSEQIETNATTCDYAAGIVDGCKRATLFVEELREGLPFYNSTYDDAIGQTFATRCAHVNDLQTECVLGDLVSSAAVPNAEDPCPVGSFLDLLDTGKITCLFSAPAASSAEAIVIGVTG